MISIKYKGLFRRLKNIYDNFVTSKKNYLSSPKMLELKSKCSYQWNKLTWFGNLLIEGGKTIFAKFKLLAYITACGLFCFLVYRFTLLNWNFVKEVYKDTTMVGLLGTLLGAVLGGVFSLLGSVTVSKQQIKAQNQIRRKNTIYKPLYDELVEIHYDILKQNPYPSIIQFQKGVQTIIPHPQFAVWGRIKADSRYLETPRKLTKLMDKLVDEVQSFQQHYDNSCISINAVFDCVLQREVGAGCTIGNIAECALEHIMTHSVDKVSEEYSDFLSPAKELNNVERHRISKIIVDECWKCESINELNRVYQSWLETEEQAIKLLAVMIKQVNASYEE